MHQRVADIVDGRASERMVSPAPPLYTAGTSANPADLLDPERFPVSMSGAAVSTPITVQDSASPM